MGRTGFENLALLFLLLPNLGIRFLLIHDYTLLLDRKEKHFFCDESVSLKDGIAM